MKRVTLVLATLVVVSAAYAGAQITQAQMAQEPTRATDVAPAPTLPEPWSMARITLPLVASNKSQPSAPLLNTIINDDCDNTYTVTWSGTITATRYVLEEATDQEFVSARVVYSGPECSWSTGSDGKLPGTYYYRVRTLDSWDLSEWSEARSITVYPIYVGLRIRWDSTGYLRGTTYANIGAHERLAIDQMVDTDTVRGNWIFWYDPNPYDYPSDEGFSYYQVSTGNYLSSSSTGDPSWKWGYPWILPYDMGFADGGSVSIGEAPFRVHGPYWGTTSYGRPIRYWEFVNTDKILMRDTGGDLTQWVLPGDAVLRYDADATGLLIYESVKRIFYYKDQATSDSVQYIGLLTAATSLPGSPPVHVLLPYHSIGSMVNATGEACSVPFGHSADLCK